MPQRDSLAPSLSVPRRTPPSYRTANRRCACRHELGHPQVQPQGQYSTLALAWMAFGISTHPYRIDYACSLCGEVLASTNDPRLLQRFY